MTDETTADDGVVEAVTAEVADADPSVEETAAHDDEATENPEGEDGDAAAPTVEEMLAFDFGGNKKEWKKGTLIDDVAPELDAFTKGLWGDYTKKSQSIAEERKALEAEKAVVQRMQGLNDELLTDFATGKALKAELAELEGIDLNALWQINPDQARQVSDAINFKRTQFQKTVQDLSAKEHALKETQAHAMAETRARQIEQGRQYIAKSIPSFDEKAIIDYAVKNGVSEADAKDWPLNPYATIVTHKAMLYDRMQEQAKKAQASKAPQVAAPVKPMTSKPSSGSKDPNKMSMAEYAEWRQRQMAKK